MGTFLAISLALASAFNTGGLWHEPTQPGHGVLITEDRGYGSAVFWFLHDREGEPVWLISVNVCTEYPCTVELAEPVGAWMGTGPLELVAVGEATINPISEQQLEFYYRLAAWPRAGECGRLLGEFMRRCTGDLVLDRLAY